VVRQTVEAIAAELPRAQAAVMRSLLKPRFTDGALRLLGAQAALFEPMLRNTVNATIVRGGAKINVVPSEIELELDGRALPGFTPDDLIAELQGIVGDDVEVELVRHDPGPSAPDLGLFETLAGVIRELDPDGIPIPLLQIGVTDGRFFSQAGIQTYGFLPMRLPQGFAFNKLIHAADERIPVDALEFGAEAVWRAVQRFH
jgi:acetylornithine deacetylase/succinyl-diaminopimelate desuccinylase-like protein